MGGVVIPEQTKITSPNCLSQLIVCLQGLAQPRLGEVLVLRDLPQQQAHQDEPLADHHSEAQGAIGSLKGIKKLSRPSARGPVGHQDEDTFQRRCIWCVSMK